MTRIRSRYELLFNMICACLVLLMAACGGGGGLLADGGIGGSGVVSAGSVSSLGSIVVNGVHYRVTGANYTREDEDPVELTDEFQQRIRVGMVVEVDGELDTDGINGQALTVRYEDVLEGPIEAVTSSGTTQKVLTILQQPVFVEDGITVLNGFVNGFTFADLDSYGGILEVSGFRLNDGRIQATYLEARAPGRHEIKGIVTSVGSGAFNIGNLNVIYAGPVTVSIDDLVEVKGISTNPYAEPNLTAETVTIETGGFSIANKDEAEIEGFVTSSNPINAGDQFLVNGQKVTYSTTTLFDGGDVTALVNGAKVEADGDLVGGVLAARKITFKEGIRLEGNLAAIDVVNGTVKIEGLTNISVLLDATNTDFDNTTGLSGATPLVVGDHVRLRGQATATAGTMLATRLTLRDASEALPPYAVVLRGPVEDDPIVNDQVTILGLSVNTTTVPIFSVEESDGSITVTNSAVFFSGLVTRDVVQLTGEINAGSVLTWNEAEKQNEL